MLRLLHPAFFVFVFVASPKVVRNAKRKFDAGDRFEPQSIAAQEIGLPDQECLPHTDMAAYALVSLEPFDAAEPIRCVAKLVIAVRCEVVGRLNRQIPTVAYLDEIRKNAACW